MHKLIPLKAKLFFIIALTTAIAYFIGLVTTHPLTIGLTTAIIDVLLLWIGTHTWAKLCHMPVKPAWFIDLSGEWEGEIYSKWKKNPDDPPLPPIPTKMLINQNWHSIGLRLSTDKMKSRSSGALPTYDKEHRELHIKYFYETDPSAEFRDVNPPQTGCAYLTVKVDSPYELTIRYTNDRGLGGDIILKKQNLV